MSSGTDSPASGVVNPDEPISVKPAGAPEFTLRAIFVGFIVSAIVAASYPYMVLKLGFGPNISVVSAFLGYIILGLVFRFLAKNFNRWENNIIQTAGTAGGQTAFLCVVMAAFDMLRMDPALGFTFELQPWQTFLWLSTAGTLGALLAVPMRQHFIIDEKLRFPDGVAVAETLVILDSKARSAFHAAVTLMSGFVVSAATALLVHFKAIAGAIHFWPAMTKYGVGLDVSFLSYGSGMLVGMRINWSMMAGSILSWVVAPYLLIHYGVLTSESPRKEVLFWVMWPATGMLVAGGFAALIFRWRVMVKTFRQLGSARMNQSGDFPMQHLIIGIALSAAALVLVQRFVLHMPIWMTIVAMLLTVPLMLVGLRVLGETNWGPISALSNLMQGFFGLFAPGNVQANMVASGVTGSVAIESEALMQDFKTAHLIGATPKYLTYMQLMAVPVGAAVLALVYPMVRDAYGLNGQKSVVREKSNAGIIDPTAPTVFVAPAGVDLSKKVKKDDQVTIVRDKDHFVVAKVVDVQGGRLTLDQAVPADVAAGDVRWRIDRAAPDSLSSPISTKWSGFATILGKGLSALPKGALVALGIGVLLGIAFTALEQDKRIKPWAPSPTGIGIGMLVPMGPIFAMFLGGVTEWIWRKADRKSSEQFVTPLASGMIAGDALMYTVLAILIFAGVGWAAP